MINLQQKLNPRQREAWKILCQKTKYLSLYGGARSGKTVLFLEFEFIMSLMAVSRHLIVRKFLSDLKRSVWTETLPKVIDLLEIPKKYYNLNKSDYIVQFVNGSEIWFGGMENKNVQDKVLGKEYTSIWVNEASEFDEALLPNLVSRLAQNSGLYNRMFFDFNPPETTHWTHRLIFDGEFLGKKQTNISHMLMNPWENRHNLAPDYLETLDGLPERQRKRFLLGEFVSPDEAIFTEDMIRWTDALQNPLPKVFDKVVIGIDPASTDNKKSDETGIMSAGRVQDHYFKLRDLSGKFPPDKWALAALKEYMYWLPRAKEVLILAETNQGGDMVRSVLNNVAKQIGIKFKYESRHETISKHYRAEAFSVMLVRQNWRWWHESNFKVYNQQLLGYTHLVQNNKSPDRVDAAILCALGLQKDLKHFFFQL